MTESAAIVLRTAILSIGWPVLIVGSFILSFMGWQFAKITKGTIFAKLVFPSVLGWLLTMYMLGITATLYMFDVPRKGTLIVLPVFLVWSATFFVLVWTTRRWSIEAIKVKDFYAHLEEEAKERTKDLAQAALRQQEQIKEFDRVTKQLVRRDFELQQINDQLREMDQAKSQFVSLAAHQLRTPLSAIKWTINLMLENDFGDISKEQRDALGRAYESTERIIALVDDLLNVARIESGQMIYKFEAITLEALLDDLTKEANARLYEKNIFLHIALPDSPLPEARGDREKLLLAFQNILENAIIYTPYALNQQSEHRNVITVTLRQKDRHYYQLMIADRGIGIPPHQKSLLFQKFFRGDNAMRQQIAGTGLGLYITKRIIEAHGGTITVESEEHKGSVFTITIPFLTL